MMPRYSRLAILLLPLACSPKEESRTSSPKPAAAGGEE
jgi:hypothetical protein